MELVLQRASRDELLRVAEQAGWRIQPELLAAVKQAVQEYHAERAPLYPLPEIQRLGYLDEEDTIECKPTCSTRTDGSCSNRAGVIRSAPKPSPSPARLSRPNAFTGEDEELEYSGQELAFFIEDRRGETNSASWTPNSGTTPPREIPNAKRVKDNDNRGAAVDFTLQELCAHFVIPDVPDVATVNPPAMSITWVNSASWKL